MYHSERFRRLGILLLTLALAGSLSSVSSWARPGRSALTRKAPELAQCPEAALREWPVLPPPKALKHKPARADIYQFDREPLAGREPLLLIHGLRGEYREVLRWDRVIKHFQSSPAFAQRYKIYLLRYDSTDELAKVVPQLKEELIRLHRASGDRPVTLVALSLGGSLVQEAMLDPAFDSAVTTVLTLGAPFHGSPLFCADWFQWSLYKNVSYPWTRLDHSWSYQLYFARNPSLLQDLRWDNSDGYIPDVGKFRSLLPLGPKGNLTLSRDANPRLSEINGQPVLKLIGSGAAGRINKLKFITYAGYLVNPYMFPGLRLELEKTILYPYTLITTKLPAHLAREHPVLKMLNHEIARVIPGGDAEKVDNWRHLYALNDGITPVNSALFLPAETLKATPLGRESDLSRLRGATDVRQARVFRNLDHLSFIDGYRPLPASPLLRDELNPQDGYRQIFDWMLADLLQSAPAPGPLARESGLAGHDKD